MSKRFKNTSKPTAARVYALYRSLMHENRRDFVVDTGYLPENYVDRNVVLQTMMDTLGIAKDEVIELARRGWHEKYGEDKLCRVQLTVNDNCWCWQLHRRNCSPGWGGCKHTFIEERDNKYAWVF